jgi:hypothetical protein
MERILGSRAGEALLSVKKYLIYIIRYIIFFDYHLFSKKYYREVIIAE